MTSCFDIFAIPLPIFGARIVRPLGSPEPLRPRENEHVRQDAIRKMLDERMRKRRDRIIAWARKLSPLGVTQEDTRRFARVSKATAYGDLKELESQRLLGKHANQWFATSSNAAVI